MLRRSSATDVAIFALLASLVLTGCGRTNPPDRPAQTRGTMTSSQSLDSTRAAQERSPSVFAPAAGSFEVTPTPAHLGRGGYGIALNEATVLPHGVNPFGPTGRRPSATSTVPPNSRVMSVAVGVSSSRVDPAKRRWYAGRPFLEIDGVRTSEYVDQGFSAAGSDDTIGVLSLFAVPESAKSVVYVLPFKSGEPLRFKLH